MNKNKAKPTKTSTRWEKGQKLEPGKQNDKEKLKMSIVVLQEFRFTTNALGDTLEK